MTDWQERMRERRRYLAEYIGPMAHEALTITEETSLELFELVGELYRRATGHLRPGKDDPMQDSNSPENTGRFNAFLQSKLKDALMFQEVMRLRKRIEELEEASND